MNEERRRAFMTALTYFAFAAILLAIAYVSFLPEYSSTIASGIGLFMTVVGFVCALIGVVYILIGIINFPSSERRDPSSSLSFRVDAGPSEISYP